MHCPLFSSVKDLYAVSDTANLKQAQIKPSIYKYDLKLTVKKRNLQR
jgi:hypothetical protein